MIPRGIRCICQNPLTELCGKQRVRIYHLWLKKKDQDLVQLKSDIVEFAKSLGFKSVGVTKIDRRFVSVEVDDELIYDTMIILGYEMPQDVVHNYPTPKHDTAAYYGYSHCARYVHDIADFIRSRGHDCRARSWEGFIKYSVHAVNAGLGNFFSTYGICHTLKWAPV